MIGIIAILLVFAGLCMAIGFWPVALIIAGLALLAWNTRHDWASGE